MIPCLTFQVVQRDNRHAGQLHTSLENECLRIWYVASNKYEKANLSEVRRQSCTGLGGVTGLGYICGRVVTPTAACKIVLHQSLHCEIFVLLLWGRAECVRGVRATQTVEGCIGSNERPAEGGCRTLT